MIMLNIGCGTSLHSAWVNLDLAPLLPGVKAFDLRAGLPFADGSVDVCYSSHVLEHLTAEEGVRFISEQRRVLRPGGVIRVVVPDLERIGRNYVRDLDDALAGGEGAADRYDYTLLEMFDQVSRSVSGGGLKEWLRNASPAQMDLAVARHGESIRAANDKIPSGRGPGLLPRAWAKARRLAVEAFAGLLLGSFGARSVREGFFRNRGEVHRRMYDRYSLGRLLKERGFVDARVCSADDSAIPGFGTFGLDQTGGKVRKPDSLFMEARVAG